MQITPQKFKLDLPAHSNTTHTNINSYSNNNTTGTKNGKLMSNKTIQ